MLTGTKVGRYEVRSRLGAGGMGAVYLAHDEQMNRLVALKLLSAEFSGNEIFKQRFKQEARAVSALNHPNIITIYEVGEAADNWFIAVEYVEGETLRQHLKNAALKITLALRFAEQIAGALIAAHERGIIHRDIKPENIMIRPDGWVKVLDFGLAKTLPNSALTKNKQAIQSEQIVSTAPGIVMGSVRYMSPEQARGNLVDQRTDIWSLGAVLYEMLAGRAAFDGATISDTLAAIIHVEPAPLERFLPDVPPEVSRIVRKSLQKDQDRRYQTSKDLLLDLKNALYEIEHEISFENKTQPHRIISDSSENATMIHQTASANHETHVSTTDNAAASNITIRKKRRAKVIAAAVLLGVAVLAALSFGFYRWLGGQPSQAATAFAKTEISRINSDGKVSVPAISPDGKYLAYVSGETGSSSLVVRQTATDSAVTIVPTTALQIRTVAFSPTGEYVFYTLNSQDFSLNTLYQVPTLGGASKKLIVDVDSAPSFAPDGKRFAFMRHVSDGGKDIIFTADIDGSNLRELIDSRRAGFDFFRDSLAWSPDATEIFVIAGNSSGVDDEFIISEIAVASGEFKIFNAKKWNRANDLVWFRDGSGLLLAGRENQSQTVQIWLVDRASGAARAVTNDLNSYSDLGLSADGSTVITLKENTVSALVKFTPAIKQSIQIMQESPNLEGSSGIVQTPNGKLIYTRNNNRERNLWIADADGKNAQQLTVDAGYNDAPVVSADGKYIVFTSSRSGNWRIWRMEIDGKNPLQLTDGEAGNFDYRPNLTRDGKTVVFNRVFSGDRQPTVLMKTAFDGGETQPMFFDTGFASFSPQSSPDGTQIAFTAYKTTTYEKKIYVAAFENDKIGAVQKTFDFKLINSFIWSPNGKSLTYLNAEGTPNLWLLPLDGSSPQPLTDFKSGRIFSYNWSADGKSLYIVRGIVNNDLVLIKQASR